MNKVYIFLGLIATPFVLFVSYVYISLFISKIFFPGGYQILNSRNIIDSENYIVQKLLDIDYIYEFYYDEKDKNYTIIGMSDYSEIRKVTISNTGKILENIASENSEIPSDVISLDIYPDYKKLYSTFRPLVYDSRWEGRPGPIQLKQYKKYSFIWPSPCPYIGIPICNGFEWMGEALYEITHKGEQLMFVLDTNKAMFLGYSSELLLLQLPEKYNSKISFVNITRGNTQGDLREEGIYLISPK